MAGDAKFKVGDRVRTLVDFVGIAAGKEGTIAAVYGAGCDVTIEGEKNTPEDAGWYYTNHELELVASAPTPIPTPPPSTVPVRIAVAVNDLGEWRVSGANGSDDATMRYRAADALDGDCLVTFITAHVPLPEQPAEIQGTVEQENTDGHH